MGDYDRKKLFMLINQVSFAMDDVRLFLDTHPDCQKALNYFAHAKKMRDEAIEEYTHRFGPLLAYNVDVKSYWDWNIGTMPWEGDDC